MAQAHVNISMMRSNENPGDNECNSINRRKVSFNIDRNNHVSIFQNEAGQTVVNIRKGTMSVSLLKV